MNLCRISQLEQASEQNRPFGCELLLFSLTSPFLTISLTCSSFLREPALFQLPAGMGV